MMLDQPKPSGAMATLILSTAEDAPLDRTCPTCGRPITRGYRYCRRSCRNAGCGLGTVPRSAGRGGYLTQR